MAEGGESDRSQATDGSCSLTTSTWGDPSANPTDWEPVVEEEEEEEEEEDEEEDCPIWEIGRLTGHIGRAEGEDVRPDEEDVGRDRLDMTNLFWERKCGRKVTRLSEMTARDHSATSSLQLKLQECDTGGPLYIGPMVLGIRNVKPISTVGSLRSNGPQIPPPKKPLINARHVTPPGSSHTSKDGTAARSKEAD